MTGRRDTSPRRYNLPTFKAPNVVLVEGPDEFEFIRFLQKREDVQIHSYEGKDQLRLEIKTILGVEGFEDVRRVLIVRDSDSDPIAARASVLSQWSAALSCPIPNPLPTAGWFPDSTNREWNVTLLPDQSSTGDLESLLWRAVDASDHTNCIDALIRCLKNCSPVPVTSLTKARLYAWLATQKEPCKQLDWALNPKASLFDPNHPAFRDFANLLDSL